MYIFKSGWRVRLDLCFGTRLLLLDTEPLCMSGDKKMDIFKSGWRVCLDLCFDTRLLLIDTASLCMTIVYER